jgi:hypothetical protein
MSSNPVFTAMISFKIKPTFAAFERGKGGFMNNYLLLGACFLLGILLRRLQRLPDNAAAALNGFVVHISLPALTLTYVHGLHLLCMACIFRAI